MHATENPRLLKQLAGGLPGTLLVRDSQGVPRYCRVLLALGERSRRRRLARHVRRKLGFEGQDMEVIEDYLKVSLMRQQLFWHIARTSHMDVPSAGALAMSLELQLLMTVTEEEMPPPFDEARFAGECDAWPAIKANIERLARVPLAQILPGVLAFLMCWPRLRDALTGCEQLTPEQWPALEAIFALSSITDSPWFLNETLRLCPGAREWLGDLISEANAYEEIGTLLSLRETSPLDDTADDAASAASPDWALLAEGVRTAAERMMQYPPGRWGDDRAAMISTLESALAALKSYEPARTQRGGFEELLEKAAATVRSFASRPAFTLVVPELTERLSQWRAASAAQDGRALLTTFSAACEQLEDLADELEEAHAARLQIRREYQAAREAADAKPSLAAERTAHQLHERDAAAEGTLLNCQTALLDLFKPPAALDAARAEPDAEAAREPPQHAAVPAVASSDLPLFQQLPLLAQDAADQPAACAAASPAAAAPSTDAADTDRAESAAAAAEPEQAPLARQVWAALARQQLAVAYQLASLAEAEGLTELEAQGIPCVALLRAAVLANELLQPDGPIAAQITRALAAVNPDAAAGAPEARTAAHLLLCAALLRPLLLAPDSAAPDLAERLQLPDGCAQLHTLLQHLVAASKVLRHYRLSARAFSALANEEAWRGDLRRVEHEIAEWRTQAPHYRSKFQAATAIWREWHQPNGEIDLLLAPIAAQGPAAADRVQAQLERLTDLQRLDEAIREADRNSRRRGAAIHGAALEQLHLHVNEACALAAQWLAVIKAHPVKSGPRLRDLHRARAALADHRVQADRQLAQLSRHADTRIAAAAAIARAGLAQAWALFEPERPLPAAERNVQHLLCWPRLQLTECTLRYDTSLREPPQQARAALAAHADAPSATPESAASFEARLQRGDIVGASLLADITAPEDPAAAAQMRERLEPAAQEYWAALGRQLTRIGESIQSLIVYEVLSSAEGDAFTARLAALERGIGELAQADAIEQGARAIGEELDALSHKRAQQLHAALKQIRSNAASADVELVEQALAANDLPAAQEYLTRMRSGEALKDSSAQPRDPFQELYGSSLARGIEVSLDVSSQEQLWARIERGATIGGLDFAALPGAQRPQAVQLLRRWEEVKGSLSGPVPADARWLKPLQQLLPLLGFTGVSAVAIGSSDVLEAEIECDPIAARAICPLPVFGSNAQGRYRCLGVPQRTSIDQLVTLVAPTADAKPTLVFYFGRLNERQRRELAAETRAKRCCFIVLDEVLLLFLTGERRSRLPALFACTLPFACSDPYVTASSVVPPELFFGRQHELDRLLDPLGACFVYGGRELGKTALMKHAERAFNASSQHHCAIWIDLKAAQIGWSAERNATHVWRPIWKHLVEAGLLPATTPEPRPSIKGRVEQFLAVFESWLASHPQERLLLLLDEADRFLEDDARRGYLDTARFKHLMESSERRFKVAFAGLHNVLRTAEQANHPLRQFGEPIAIGPLSKDWREAQRLVLGPLEAAGYTLERPSMADRILAQTNFHPGLIQLYCSKLIGRMMEEGSFSSGPRFVIREQTLDETYLSKDLREQIRQKFRLTLQLDPRYAVIAYAIAHHCYAERCTRAGMFTPAELAAMARDWWDEGFARTSAPEFRTILEEMVGLSVLRAGEEGTFTLRHPNLPLLMGTEEEVNEELLRPRDLPEMFSPQEFHPPLAGNGAIAGRHPLTMAQISALGSGRDGVVIIAGTRAAGITRVAAALQQEHGAAHLVALPLVTEPRNLAQRLHEGLAARAGGTTIFLVSPDCPWSESWVGAALGELRHVSAKKRRAKVVFIADASSAVSHALPALARREGVEVMTVRPWSEDFVRQCLEEAHVPDGPAQRAALHARTGFWPLLLEDGTGDTAARVTISAFTGRHTLLGNLLTAMAEHAGAGDGREVVQAEELAAITEENPEAVRSALALAELLAIASPAARGGWRLEQGLASLFHYDRIARAPQAKAAQT